ncbi:MAG: DUF4412 domain-containing protein [bacterium]|nr:DUF4412 domain-containing protein [bacterium]
MRIMLVVTAVTVTALAAGCGGPVTSFSAEQVTRLPGQPEQIVRVFVAPQKLRMEMEVPMGAMVNIVREDLGIMWMLVPERQAYREMPMDEAQLNAMMREVNQEQITEELGTETVNGFPCRKVRITTNVEVMGMRHEGTAVVWTTPALPMPIRSETEDGAVSELREIKPGAQPEELFEIPEGYEKTEMGMFDLFAGGESQERQAEPSLSELSQKVKGLLKK